MRTQDLLTAVLSQSGDDWPRLAYAHALTAEGDLLRAEFIRTQVALSRISEDDPQRPTLRKREAELLTAHGAGWAGPRASIERQHPEEGNGWQFGPIVSERDEWQFRRGFVEVGQMTAWEFLSSADRIFSTVPVREIFIYGLFRRKDNEDRKRRAVLLDIEEKMYGAADPVAPLAACEQLRRLPRLGLNCLRPNDQSVAELLASKNLASTDLRLHVSFHSGAIAHALAASPVAHSLDTLRILYGDEISYSGNFGIDGATALGEMPPSWPTAILDATARSHRSRWAHAALGIAAPSGA